MRDLEPLTLADFDRAPFRIVESVRFSVPPARVFDAFADASLWTRWWPLMHEARYTSGTGGLGSQRRVALRGLGAYEERFIAWEPGVRFAFTMIATSSPLVARMGEDYRLSADGTGTRLDWIAVAHPRGIGKVSTPITRTILKTMLRRGAPTLERLLVG